MSRAVTIVGGGLAGVLAAFEAHRQGADLITLYEQADHLGGSARSRFRHGLELRTRPILFGPPSDPVAGLLEDYGASLRALADQHTGGPLGCLPTGGFVRLLDTCHTRLRALGVRVQTRKLFSPSEALASDDIVIWTSDASALCGPLGLKRPVAKARVDAAYAFCAYWDGPLPFVLDADGPLRRVYLYDAGGGTVLNAESDGEMDDEGLRRAIAVAMAGTGGYLKVAAFLGERIHTRWAPVAGDTALAWLEQALAARCEERFILADWSEPSTDAFLALRRALDIALEEAAPLRAAG
jgi:hypothetical protein